MNVRNSATYEAVIETGETGLTGTIGSRVNDNLGATSVAFSSANVTEIATGVYAQNSLTAPTARGQYTIIWTRGSGGEVLGTEDLVVTDSAGAVGGTTPYATVAQLAALLKRDATTYADEMTSVLTAAAEEIDAELGRDAPFDDPPPELVIQVNLERAVEHWHARPVGFGVIGLDTEAPVRLARDTWDRHAFKLAPLKETWGLA